MKKSVLFRLSIFLFCTFKSNDLGALAKFFGTDKEGSHSYTRHYQYHFAPLRTRLINILEIGVGGHKNPESGGASLRMWKYYFPHSNIYGIDVHDKKKIEERRIKIFQGNQADSEFLKKVVSSIGKLHIVIDDGSHKNSDVIASFQTLFPLLEPGGIYAVEDIEDMPDPVAMKDFFKNLTDVSLHFYHNIVFIYKERT